MVMAKAPNLNEPVDEDKRPSPSDRSGIEKGERLWEGRQISRHFESSLPWWVTFFLKINRYIMENKIEASIYFFLLLLLTISLVPVRRK